MITINLCDLLYHRPVTNVHTPKAVWIALVKIEEPMRRGQNLIPELLWRMAKLQCDRGIHSFGWACV